LKGIVEQKRKCRIRFSNPYFLEQGNEAFTALGIPASEMEIALREQAQCLIKFDCSAAGYAVLWNAVEQKVP
jgi:hypothetical protein